MRLDQVRLARPYAEAISRIATTSQEIDSWSRHLSCLKEIVGLPETTAFLKNPTTSFVNKKNLLLESWNKFSPALPKAEAEHLLDLLLHNHRIFILPELIETLESLRDQRNHQYKAVVEGAYPLQDGEQAIIESWLRSTTGENVYIEYHINPDLLSGFKAKIGDKNIYASTEHLLTQLEEKLKRDE